jgi:transcriptional regulator with XRE-family HTH domain
MMILTDLSLTTAEIIRTLGVRFKDYRMRMNKTRKQVSVETAIGMTTLYKFETGNITDMSVSTLLKLLRAINLYSNWQQIIPELPESPYLYDDNMKKKQRIRHSKQS